MKPYFAISLVRIRYALFVCLSLAPVSMVRGAMIPGTSVTPALWLEAGSGVTTSGASVTGWADQSGNGRNASVPGGGSTSPTLVSGVQTGPSAFVPVVRFNGTSDTLTGATAGLTLSGMEGFVVARLANTTVANGGVASLATASAADYQTGGAILWTAGFAAGSPTGAGMRYNSTGGDNLTLALGNFYIHDVDVSNVAGVARGNVSAQDTMTQSTTTPLINANLGLFANASPTYYALGARALGGGTVGFNGAVDIAAVILYDAPLSSTDRAAVQSYLFAAYVPEPATASFLAVCALAMLRNRRNRAQ